MAIKNLRFSFDVPIHDLLALVATRNESLRIEVIGDGKDHVPKQLRNGAAEIAGLLAPPKSSRMGIPMARGKDAQGNTVTGYEVVAKIGLADPEHIIRSPEAKAAMTAAGLKPQSVSPVISVMFKAGHVTRLSNGVYKITKTGITAFKAKGYLDAESQKGAAKGRGK